MKHEFYLKNIEDLKLLLNKIVYDGVTNRYVFITKFYNLEKYDLFHTMKIKADYYVYRPYFNYDCHNSSRNMKHFYQRFYNVLNFNHGALITYFDNWEEDGILSTNRKVTMGKRNLNKRSVFYLNKETGWVHELKDGNFIPRSENAQKEVFFNQSRFEPLFPSEAREMINESWNKKIVFWTHNGLNYHNSSIPINDLKILNWNKTSNTALVYKNGKIYFIKQKDINIDEIEINVKLYNIYNNKFIEKARLSELRCIFDDKQNII